MINQIWLNYRWQKFTLKLRSRNAEEYKRSHLIGCLLWSKSLLVWTGLLLSCLAWHLARVVVTSWALLWKCTGGSSPTLRDTGFQQIFLVRFQTINTRVSWWSHTPHYLLLLHVTPLVHQAAQVQQHLQVHHHLLRSFPSSPFLGSSSAWACTANGLEQDKLLLLSAMMYASMSLLLCSLLLTESSNSSSILETVKPPPPFHIKNVNE